MALFEVTAYDKKIYEEELKDFLSDKILDVHTHVWLDEYLEKKPPQPGFVKRTVTWPSLVALDNSLEDLQETYRLMFPGKDVKALMFTSRGGWEQNNAYVAECARKTGWPALYYSDPAESAAELEKHIREGGFLGLKSYLDLSPKYLPEAEIRIFDFFPKNHLEVLDRMGAIAMLHIPRHGRLKDPVNLAQILELKELKKIEDRMKAIVPYKINPFRLYYVRSVDRLWEHGDSVSVEVDSLVPVLEMHLHETSDTLYEGLNMIIKVDSLAVKDRLMKVENVHRVTD